MPLEQTGSQGRPPLPPRQSRTNSPRSTHDPPPPPPPYELLAHQQRALDKATAGPSSGAGAPLMRNDPRSSSQDSLAPEATEQGRRRTLLLVYIHGFMGSETSFRSFPAHVHNLLTVLVGGSHIVHSKLYPRYRSRGSISFARDNFSKWLEPHESTSTDVVLLGHSMGGLLAAEVALAPAPSSASSPLKHRILGTVNFDVPFLGMHTGVVKSGLASIFKSSEEADDRWEGQPQQTSSTTEGFQAEDAADSRPSRMDTLWGKIDPNFNPKFANDVALPVRKGWRNAWHFVNKHSDDLVKSTKKLVTSHMEFGGAMANYNELKTRYARVRALEEEDARIRQTVVERGVPSRVRFVNYYTSSTGRPKKSLSPLRRLSPSPHGSRPSSKASASAISIHSVSNQSTDSERLSAAANRSFLSISDTLKHQKGSIAGDNDPNCAMTSSYIENSASDQPYSLSSTANEPAVLPDLPPAPPALGDLSYIQDENIRRLVADEHARAVKKYDTAVKERETLQLRREIGEQSASGFHPKYEHEKAKRQKSGSEMTHSEKEALRLEKEKERMEAEGRRLRGETWNQTATRHSIESIPRIESRTPSMPASTVDSVSTYDSSMLTPQQSTQSADTTATSDSRKAKKDRKFCNLPPKDKNGQLDPCWVRVFMENVDEVGAHCGLFFVDERYERLVGDVAERVEQWVLENDGIRSSRMMNQQPAEKVG